MRGLRSLWKTAGKGLAREARRKNTQYAARQIAKYACQRTSVLKDIGVTFTRYVAGALLAPKAPTVVDKFVEAIE
jgi:ribosomal protein S11